ncbi:MAG: peptidoglycan DD-metalloendopeptidase family protein [Pseudomonadota bacterium]
MRRLLACLIGGLLLAAYAQADDRDDIDKARRLLAEAQTALERAEGTKGKLAALGKAVRAQEAALAAYRAAMRHLAQEDQALSIGLEQDSGQLAGYLAALQSIGLAPQSAFLVFPGGPVRAARAAILIGDVTPRLEARMALLRGRLDEIRALREQQEEARIETRTALAGLQQMRTQTTKALRGRIPAPGRADLIEQAETAEARAGDLDQLAVALQANAASRAPVIAFDDLKGTLALPVEGDILAEFGAAKLDRNRFGLVIEAPAFAQVSAPVDAAIRYAGPLVGYDQVVVLEPESGWMIVIGGLAHIDRTVGEAVLAGEKLGDLGGPLPTSEEFLMEAGKPDGEIADETVYIEFRRQDAPIDPMPWFALDG